MITPPVVLCVDDCPAILAAERMVLRAAGFDVETAESVAAAMDAAHRHHPDCVITDLMMPGEHGTALLKQMDEDPELSGVPRIVATAYCSRDALREGYDAMVMALDELGTYAIIDKPFDPDKLVATVRAAIEGRL